MYRSDLSPKCCHRAEVVVCIAGDFNARTTECNELVHVRCSLAFFNLPLIMIYRTRLIGLGFYRSSFKGPCFDVFTVKRRSL